MSTQTETVSVIDGVSSRDVAALREWVNKQAHLVNDNIDDALLRRFIHCCCGSIEKAKAVLQTFCTQRSAAPEFFNNRDPLSPSVQTAFEVVDAVPLPQRTKEDNQLFLYRLSDTDPSKLVYDDYVKMLLLVADTRMLREVKEKIPLPSGDIPIFDMAGLTIRHLGRVSLPSMRKYMHYFQEAHPVRLKQIHVINVPSFIDKCMALVKPFMRREVAAMVNDQYSEFMLVNFVPNAHTATFELTSKRAQNRRVKPIFTRKSVDTSRRLHFHQPGSTTLYEFIPQEILPSDYGGKQPSVAEIKAKWRRLVEDNRKFFLDERGWKSDETKRVGHNGYGQARTFGVEGSFRSLKID